MVFSSVTFLFLFLPIVLGIHFVIPEKHRNSFLLFSSLFFYAWGEYNLVLVMITSILINFAFGIFIEKAQHNKNDRRTNFWLLGGVTINLAILGFYKYIQFLLDNLTKIGLDLNSDFSHVTLPIGISFFTFQSISYLIDVHRKTIAAQRSIINLGMYIALFPQLIAGPIVRYVDILKEIQERHINAKLFKSGVDRFIIGFSKKVLIANNTGFIADKIFAVPGDELSSILAWLGILFYALQIYFDFSGYSDMAIGLGKMLGFNFKENFNYPYISSSIQEFWRRWHISLSSWFRDYLYIPLGGNRKGASRTLINLIIVFFLTGLWHGASWNFVIWGLFHGFFLILERITNFKLPKLFKPLKHIYTLVVVLIGWVFFRIEGFYEALQFLGKLFAFDNSINNQYPWLFLNNYYMFILVLGIVLSTPIKKVILERIPKNTTFRFLSDVVYISLLMLSIFELSQSTYNPFIYFRF